MQARRSEVQAEVSPMRDAIGDWGTGATAAMSAGSVTVDRKVLRDLCLAKSCSVGETGGEVGTRPVSMPKSRGRADPE